MHEYSLARSLLNQVDALRRGQPGGRVLAVKVRVGEFSGVEPELLASAFENLSVETELGGARLEMERVPLAIRCETCGSDGEVRRFRFVCPLCGSRSVRVIAGEELFLDSVTMECAQP
jgi:hydrogenase nickel incorporation protein HypA/HybF